MLATLLLATLTAVAAPPITVLLNNDGRYLPGEAVRVSVRAEADGYLLVLHADPDGRLRVLFPLDPTDDAYVKGGRTYDLRTRGDRRDLFIADWNRGSGTILAALSSDPLQVTDFSVNGHWDYRSLNLDQSLDDESALRTIAQKMAPGGIQYDVVPYIIGDGYDGIATTTTSDDGSTTVIQLGVGYGYGYGYGWNVGWYDPWWGYPCCGWGWGINIGWGYYPWWGYPAYPVYPAYPIYPGYPVYPGYPGYPGYGHYPYYGGG